MPQRGPFAVIALCVFPVVLWGLAVPLDTRFVDPATSLSSVAVVFALVGVSAFAVNLILGSRLPFVHRFFGGLENLYRVHRIVGRATLLLLLTHAALMIASRATVSLTDALGLLLPSAGWTVFFGVVALGAMTLAVALTLYARLSHEMFVYVQRSLGFVFLVATLHVFGTPGTKAVSFPLTLYLGALSAVAVLAFAYRSLFGNVLVLRHDYDVTSVRRLDRDVVEITMSPRGKRLEFTPGQFLYVTFYSSAFNAQFHPVSVTSEGETAMIALRPGDVSNQFHPFSITSAPQDPDLRIVVKAVGDYTSALHKLDEGATARVEGPYGEFSYLNVPNRRQIWIAGGIGVTPFVSMARSLDASTAYEIDLYYATKRAHEAYFLDEFSSISEKTPSFRVIAVPEDRSGLVTAERVEATSGGLTDKDTLICGPPAMIDSLRAQLGAKGVPKRRIHFENFGFRPRPRPQRRPAPSDEPSAVAR